MTRANPNRIRIFCRREGKEEHGGVVSAGLLFGRPAQDLKAMAALLPFRGVEDVDVAVLVDFHSGNDLGPEADALSRNSISIGSSVALAGSIGDNRWAFAIDALDRVNRKKTPGPNQSSMIWSAMARSQMSMGSGMGKAFEDRNENGSCPAVSNSNHCLFDSMQQLGVHPPR